MSDRYCCAECFGDDGLRLSIIPELQPRTGECSYCSSNSSTLLRPEALRDAVEALVSIYRVDDDGLPLPVILRQDWGLFTHAVMDDAHVKELLADILDDGDLVRRTFVALPAPNGVSLARWDDLRDEMMHRNRWFLQEQIDFDRLSQLLDLLIADPATLSTRWHRARIMEDETPYPLSKMSAPPHRLAGHGRANPAGIPYLYLGSTAATAVAEVRPHTGETACVAQFTLPSIRAVDLRAPRMRVSPFTLDDGDISQLRADLPLLERLGDELTRPVLPRGAAFEYIPSQYLCEFIKSCGFDGVIYRSSVGDGINVALFDPAIATGIDVVRYEVKRVAVHIAAATS